MPNSGAQNSVGLVSPCRVRFETAFQLANGSVLAEHELVYETYGELNAAGDNAVLICHALSGTHHAAGFYADDGQRAGWWDLAIGPGKPIDTRRLFVVCSNNIGGCDGSTGPNTLNPKTGKPWGAKFPQPQVQDWVRSQKLLAEYLGISRWAAVIGGSLGGMQALQWAIDYPEWVEHCVALAAAPKLTAQNIAFNEVARQAIMKDPNWHDGNYIEKGVVPAQGLSLARMLGHITYLSDESMGEKFGRELKQAKLNFNYDVEFQIESYLRYQGEKFVTGFDANTYLLMTKSLDYFDPIKDFGASLNEIFKSVKSKYLVVSFTSDWRFPPKRSREIVKLLLDNEKDVSYSEINSEGGHDAFLMDNEDYFGVMKSFIDEVNNGI